jgi:hypothetical protein
MLLLTQGESLVEGSQFLRRIVSADFQYFGACELFTTFFVWVPSMALKPLSTHAVRGSDLIQLPPQVIILDRHAVCSAPMVGFPT